MKRILSSIRTRILNKRVLLSVGAAALVLGSSVAVGSVVRANTARAEVATTTTTLPPTTTIPPTTTTQPVGEPDPAPVTLPALDGQLRQGSSGDVVKAYEQRLADLRFDPGEVDGKFDAATTFAVQTLQKVMGFERTGRIGDEERTALNTFKWPKPLKPDGGAKRFEVDIDKQVGTLYVDNKIKLMTTVSTGASYYYCWVPKTGGTRICEYADTPSGSYRFYTKYNGWQEGDLGRIYNPVYFNGGIAVHGYPQVPVQPASHGCVRIPMYVADYFPSLVSTGDPVYVIGGPEGRRPVTYTPIPVDATPTPAPSTAKPSPSTTPTTVATTTTTAAPTTTTTAAPTTTTTS